MSKLIAVVMPLLWDLGWGWVKALLPDKFEFGLGQILQNIFDAIAGPKEISAKDTLQIFLEVMNKTAAELSARNNPESGRPPRPTRPPRPRRGE